MARRQVAGSGGSGCARFFYYIMPKTYNNIWSQVFDFENLYAAFMAARKGKRDRPDVARFSMRAEERLIEIQNHLIWKSWRPGRCKEFWVRDPKRRLIQAPPFADRILHHALVRVIEPLFERKFIDDSFACRRSKGVHAAVRRVQGFMRAAQRGHGKGCYVLKADIAGYFASVRHDILMAEIARTIIDKDVLWLWDIVLSGYGHDGGVGLPVGALTSQLAANILLNHLDHAAKDDLGLRYYARYMDDFVVILPNKMAARDVMRVLGGEVSCLGLMFNPKTQIFPCQRGIDFCGYRIWPTHILPRKRNIKRARKTFAALRRKYRLGKVDLAAARQQVMSFLAYTKHCNAKTTVKNILKDFVL